MDIALGTQARVWADIVASAQLHQHPIPFLLQQYDPHVARTVHFLTSIRAAAYVTDNNPETMVIIRYHGPVSLLRILKHEELHIILHRLGLSEASEALDKVDSGLDSAFVRALFGFRERLRIRAEHPNVFQEFLSIVDEHFSAEVPL